MPRSERQRRHAITDKERKSLREKYRERPDWDQKQLASWFEDKFRHSISQSTISESLSSRFDRVDSINLKRGNNGFSKKSVSYYPDLEAALFEWQQRLQTKHTTITGDMIKEAAAELWSQIPSLSSQEPPKFSSGWLDGFKRRHQLKEYKRHGEAGSANQNCEVEMENIRIEVKKYDSDNVYNMDQTALFWKLIPDRTLATEKQSGLKKEKARITLVCSSNATGSDRVPLWVIGKAKKPRCFHTAKIQPQNLGIIWRHNGKAWMNTAITIEWLQWFDSRMRAQNKKVLLLLDNFKAHHTATEQITLTNTKVLFLPPNATSLYQPLDQGIIANLKANWRRYWVRYMVDLTLKDQDPIKKMHILQAVRWCVTVWHTDIQDSTIANCFRKSTIFGVVNGPEPRPTDAELIYQIQEATNRLHQLGKIREIMDIRNFINPPEEVVADNSDDIIADIVEQFTERDAETDEEEDIQQKVKPQEAIQALQLLRLYEEQSDDCDIDLIRRLNQYEKRLVDRKIEGQQQQLISSFFQASKASE